MHVSAPHQEGDIRPPENVEEALIPGEMPSPVTLTLEPISPGILTPTSLSGPHRESSFGVPEKDETILLGVPAGPLESPSEVPENIADGTPRENFESENSIGIPIDAEAEHLPGQI